MKFEMDDLVRSLDSARCYESTDGTQGKELVGAVIKEVNMILKHRSCNQCKFWITQGETSRCRKDVITLSNKYHNDYNRFYCKKWECIK